jgi:hypothetical protein
MGRPPVVYTIAVSKGSALIDETKALLRAWEPAESLADFRRRIVRGDLLGKMTAQRADDVVRRVFAPRFLLPSDGPARQLKRLVESGQANALVVELCLLYAARQDALLRDAIVEVYWPVANTGQLVLSPRDIITFLHQGELNGRIPEPWSVEVKIRVARGLLRALRDFGLLREERRGRREIVAHRPNDRTVVYLAYELHDSGLTDAAVVEHDDWALYGLSRGDVVTTMDRLSGEGWWILQAAVSVVRVTWQLSGREEVVDALAR